jgi:hypothetical protein
MSARPMWWCAAVLAASALAQQPPQPAQPSTDPATASIEGTVVDAVSGAPIRKAQVQLGGMSAQGGGQTNLRAGADASGRFVFRGLLSGSYWMNAQHPNYSAIRTGVSTVTLQPGEAKTGIEIRLNPQASISGTVVDEFGAPVTGCSTMAMPAQARGSRRGPGWVSANTTELGEYLIQGLEKGRYFVFVQCGGQLEAPHPLMSRRDPRRPYLVYASQFYPGVPDRNGATAVRVSPGTETQGIDFQMRRTSGVTVRGHVDPPESFSSAGGGARITLVSPNVDQLQILGRGGAVNPSTGEFTIQGVTPGDYLLVANSFGSGPAYYAQLPVSIGATQPEPLRIVLSPAPNMSGRVEIEGDNPPALDSLQVFLQAVVDASLRQPQPAPVGKDGAFTLTGVTPGKWRLTVMGTAYPKAVTIGAKAVSPYAFDLAPGAIPPVRIILSNKTGQVEVAISATAGSSASVLLVPADPDLSDSGLVRIGTAQSGSQAVISGVVPGRYRLYAFESAEAQSLVQQPEVLKVLESHAQTVEVGEGETVPATAAPISAAELASAVEQAQ